MKKKLTKSNSNIVVSGVLGGIGEFFGIDPTIVRIVYLALSFFTARISWFLFIHLIGDYCSISTWPNIKQEKLLW